MKYPLDIVSLVRKTKTFSVEAHLSRVTDESPLKIFAPYSRFVFTNISNQKAAFCNVSLEYLPSIIHRSRFASDEYLKHIVTNKPDVNPTHISKAYTLKFATGKLKGKTPVNVLTENDYNSGKAMLNEQYKWLKSNLDKYPNNKDLMDAISEASEIPMEEIQSIKETSGGQTSADIIPIIDIGCRPLIRRTRSDGKCFCYEYKVICDLTKDYPISVSIRNYYASVVHKEDGTLNVQLKTKDTESELSNDFNMTMDEWLYVVSEMEHVINDFRYMNFPDAYTIAMIANEENRNKYKEAHNNAS